MKPRKNEDVAHEARKAVEKWRTYFKYNIDQYHEIMQFVLGRQWEEEEDMLTTTLNKVPFQFNNWRLWRILCLVSNNKTPLS